MIELLRRQRKHTPASVAGRAPCTIAAVVLLANAGLSLPSCDRESPDVRERQGVHTTEPRPAQPCPATADCHEDATCTCDPQGNVLLEVGEMGRVSWRIERTFDERGNVLTVVNRSSGYRRNVPNRWSYTYDEQGNELTVERDDNLDGDVDYRAVHTYADGNRVTTEHDGDLLDGGADGMMDVRRTNQFDSDGRLTVTETDERIDGVVDRRCTFTPPCPPPWLDENPPCDGACHDL